MVNITAACVTCNDVQTQHLCLHLVIVSPWCCKTAGGLCMTFTVNTMSSMGLLLCLQVARDAADEYAMGIPQVGPRRGIDFVRLYHESVQQAAHGTTGGGSRHGSGSYHSRSGPLSGVNPAAAGATGGSSRGHNSSSNVPLGSISISAGGGGSTAQTPATSSGGTFWGTSAASTGHGTESFTSSSTSIFQHRLYNASAPLPVSRTGGAAGSGVALTSSVSAGGRHPAAAAPSQAGLPLVAPSPGSISYSLLDVDASTAEASTSTGVCECP
jgi:hypothetical protein